MSYKTNLIISLITFLFCNTLFANQVELDEFAIFNSENECRGCALTGKTFSRDTLSVAWHVNAYVANSYLINTTWQDINLQGASFHDSRGDRMHFINCNMSHINLSYSDLPYLHVEGSNHLEVVNFTGSGLEYSNFSGATLDRPYFNEAVLDEVNFTYAKIFEGKFIGARVMDADFSEAWLRDCDFTGADLDGSDFRHADLRGSKITAEQLATARSICGAILPDGSRGGC
jgi:uncharacterized protein YjbI with pentapeptide repeats